MSITDEQIRLLAYQLWQLDGCPHGQDLDYWLRAEAAIQSPQTVPLTAADSIPPVNPPESPPKSRKRATSTPTGGKEKSGDKPKTPRKSRKNP